MRVSSNYDVILPNVSRPHHFVDIARHLHVGALSQLDVLTSLQIDPFGVNQQFEIVPLMADDLLVVVNFQWQAVLPLTLWCKRPPLREICKHNEAINDCADEENEKQEGNGDEEASLKCSLGESEEQASPE